MKYVNAVDTIIWARLCLFSLFSAKAATLFLFFVICHFSPAEEREHLCFVLFLFDHHLMEDIGLWPRYPVVLPSYCLAVVSGLEDLAAGLDR